MKDEVKSKLIKLKFSLLGLFVVAITSSFILHPLSLSAATVVATVGSRPITDADITARVSLMTKQGNTATNNRKVALQNIVDDFVKLDYAAMFNVKPATDDINNQFKAMNLGELSSTERAMATNAIASDIAWQMIIVRTIVPTVDVSDTEVAAERNALAKERGLPLEMTVIRLTNIPADAAAKLTKPKSCDDAMDMARKLGGAPQKFTALHYEMTPDVRDRVTGLSTLTWSPRVDNSVLLVCSSKKTSEYGQLDQMIKQNAMFKAAMFKADQQLKQLRRKAVVVVLDERYK